MSARGDIFLISEPSSILSTDSVCQSGEFRNWWTSFNSLGNITGVRVSQARRLRRVRHLRQGVPAITPQISSTSRIGPRNVCHIDSPASSLISKEAGWSRQGPAKSLDFRIPLCDLGALDGSPWIHVLSMEMERSRCFRVWLF